MAAAGGFRPVADARMVLPQAARAGVSCGRKASVTQRRKDAKEFWREVHPESAVSNTIRLLRNKGPKRRRRTQSQFGRHPSVGAPCGLAPWRESLTFLSVRSCGVLLFRWW